MNRLHAIVWPLGLAAAVAAQDTPEVRWEPYTSTAAASGELVGRLGRLRVPENRKVKSGVTLELAFAVYETDHPEPRAPFVFLAGGPGAPGIDFAAEAATDPRIGLLKYANVIGLDQRGTGRCVPNLSEAPEFTYELPMDRAVTRDELADAYTDAVRRCVEHWKGEGVDLSAYNTEESADDIDAVRRALGLEKISLWGTSYGSHLGLAYLRKYPQHVERAVLMKVEGPDHTFKLPSNVQRVFERLDELVAAHPDLSQHLPDFSGTVRGLLAQLEKEPVVVTMRRGGQERSATIGPLDLQMVVSMALGHTPNLASLPMAVHQMKLGEWRHMLGFVARNRRGSVLSGMALAMDCASGGSAARMARIERERDDPQNVLGDAIHAPYFPRTCAPCGAIALDDAFRGPIECEVPVLFVSGELDARTPPANVEAIRAGFSHHAHVVVTNTGHDSRELESEEYRRLLARFLAGEEVESCTIELPPVPFRPLRLR